MTRKKNSHEHYTLEIMVDHFHEKVMAPGKIGGQARAMVVTSGIERAIQYYHAIKTYLVARKSPYQAIVAFSGKHDYAARLAHHQALSKAAQGSIKDYTQFYKQFVENESFKRFVGDMVYAMTNQ